MVMMNTIFVFIVFQCISRLRLGDILQINREKATDRTSRIGRDRAVLPQRYTRTPPQPLGGGGGDLIKSTTQSDPLKPREPDRERRVSFECDAATELAPLKPWSHLTVMNVVERNSFARS